MQAYTRTLILIVVGLVLPISLLSLRGQDKTKNEKQSQTVLRRADQTSSAPTEDEILPVAEAFPKEETDPQKKLKREKRNARFDKRGTYAITEGERPSNVVFSHHWSGMSAFPIEESDAVLLVNIIDSNAYLSNDRTAVYSEFIAHVKEVIKDTAESPVAQGSQVSIQRMGGAVEFPSGTVQRYTLAGQHMPRKGRSYLLFLKRTQENDFALITGYELNGQQVKPLDGSPGEKLPFELYRDSDVESFLDQLKASVASKEAERKVKQ